MMPNPDPDQLPDVGTVTKQGFPHGLRCYSCSVNMPYGGIYCSVLDDSDVAVVICPACAMTAVN